MCLLSDGGDRASAAGVPVSDVVMNGEVVVAWQISFLTLNRIS